MRLFLYRIDLPEPSSEFLNMSTIGRNLDWVSAHGLRKGLDHSPLFRSENIVNVPYNVARHKA
jgi:hypothetical protein